MGEDCEEDWDDEEEWLWKWQLLDMDMQAYSHATSLMIGLGNCTTRHVFSTGPKVQCVEIVYGQGKFGDNSAEVHRLVHLPRSHPMFHGQSTLSEVSKVCLLLSTLYRANN